MTKVYNYIFFVRLFVSVYNCVRVCASVLFIMTAKKGKFYFQKRDDSAASHHCCVPKCMASAKCNSVLSFHTFPKDGELRKKWMINIRRDKFSPTDASRVCSRHFTAADVIQPSAPGGRRILKKGAVPVLFQWNNFSVPAPRPSVWDRTEQPDPSPCAAAPDETDQLMDLDYLDHDYCSTSEPAAVDLSLGVNEELLAKISVLEKKSEEMTLSSKFGLERFGSSDEDIRFYTR